MILTNIFIALFILYLICGILNYGMTFAYFQNNFLLNTRKTTKEDKMIAFILSLTGFVGVTMIYFLSERAKYGVKFKCLVNH